MQKGTGFLGQEKKNNELQRYIPVLLSWFWEKKQSIQVEP